MPTFGIKTLGWGRSYPGLPASQVGDLQTRLSMGSPRPLSPCELLEGKPSDHSAMALGMTHSPQQGLSSVEEASIKWPTWLGLPQGPAAIKLPAVTDSGGFWWILVSFALSMEEDSKQSSPFRVTSLHRRGQLLSESQGCVCGAHCWLPSS